jgi:hypothetical protein
LARPQCAVADSKSDSEQNGVRIHGDKVGLRPGNGWRWLNTSSRAMRTIPALSSHQLILVLAGATVAVIACLSPVHNDTWWHLAYGREMATSGGWAQVDRFSYTAAGAPFPNHQWLSQRLFYIIHEVGGMPLLTSVCAALLVTGWTLAWTLAKGGLADRLLIMSAAIAGSTLIWSIRPQVVAVALLPLTIKLLVARRTAWLPVVMCLWANLHGSVLLGLIVSGVWTAVTTYAGDRHRRPLRRAFIASVAATFLTPLGAGYWPAVVASLARSRANQLQEWQPPAPPPDHVFFWGMACALLVIAARRWRRLSTADDLALAGSAFAFLLSALRSIRNIAPFLMLAGPTLTALMAVPSQPASATRSRRLFTALAIAVTIASFWLVSIAWSEPWPRLGWNPISTAVARALHDCPDKLYNTYAGGGPIIWFVPDKRVFVDSRQDSYPLEVVRAATAVEGGAPFSALFHRYGVRCAAVPPASPIVEPLKQAGWVVRAADGDWIVMSIAP